MTSFSHSSFPQLNLSQLKIESQRSSLPQFLLTIIDQIMKIDQFKVLRYDNLGCPLEQLICQLPGQNQCIWLFIDPFNHGSILSKEKALFKERSLQHARAEKYSFTILLQGKKQTLNFDCSNLLVTKIAQKVLQYVSKTQLISLDQVRLRCQANLYTEAAQVQHDLRRVISWCQVYRAKQLKSFQYLSTVYDKINSYLMQQGFSKNFTQTKQEDLKRLMLEELQFKMNPHEWPFIPQSFRQYEQIEKYVPTPLSRVPLINDRLRSCKLPVQCSSNCVCLTDDFEEGQYFCKFSLENGWETTCPNRAKKIQCNHQKEQDQKKCKNTEIKTQNRKKCKGKKGVTQEEAEIEERLTWGIDLYTRNIIYKLLPAFDVEGTITKTKNQDKKYEFIEKTLSKALNFLGNKGFSFVDACQYIKKYSQKAEDQNQKQSTHEEKLQEKQEGKDPQNKENQKIKKVRVDQQPLFSKRNWEYADLLLKNYELASEKSMFRMHTKGKGAICIDHKGIAQGSFIVEYLGEIYELWRWYDRQNLVKQVTKSKKYKKCMPQFYNIALQKHPDQPLGSDILMVDPSRKGNFSSRFSHSCNPNCGTVTTVSNGRYYVGMYAFRNIEYGEELTFDYCSMTDSIYQHLNSICLCGMRNCRGYYLQLSDTKMFSDLMESKNSFITRNSAILRASQKFNLQCLLYCDKNSIKQGIIKRCPQWLITWIAQTLKFISDQSAAYKQTLIDKWRQFYPWKSAKNEDEKQENIQNYSQAICKDLQNIRMHNLITSIDKITYVLQQNPQKWCQPPILITSHSKILDALVFKEDSVLLEVQRGFNGFGMKDLAGIVDKFIIQITVAQSSQLQLSIFRLCCLLLSHELLFLKKAKFNNKFLSDILYFYAFTHTYFEATEYDSFQSPQISVSASQIFGKASSPTEKRQKSCKKYLSFFIWGQMSTWFKQTLSCPQSTLRKERNGTLSYPTIRTIMRSQQPYKKQNRAYFLKMLLQRPTNCWSNAVGCDLSFKNAHKLYGTMLFQNVHSRKVYEGKLPKQSLLQSCIFTIDLHLDLKLNLFKTVENIFGGIQKNDKIYQLAELAGDKSSNFSVSVHKGCLGQPRKRIKKDYTTFD